jgi:hypothetical protein
VAQYPSPTFAAGTAANPIAQAVEVDGAGLFICSNRGPKVSRAAYSTNLKLATADLSVVARIESTSGGGTLLAIPGFDAKNFALAPLREPGRHVLLLAGLASIGAVACCRGVG